jgi:preprotein translocase subunit YajC
MHYHLIILAADTTTTAAKKSSSSSTLPFIFIIVIFAAVYLLFIRPRQQRMRQQQTQARELAIGDPVVTAGGIQGRIVALDSDVAEVEVAPGVVLTMLRRAVNRRPDAPAGPQVQGPPDNWNPSSHPEDEPPGEPPDSRI